MPKIKVQYIPANHPEAAYLPYLDEKHFQVFNSPDDDTIIVRVRGDIKLDERLKRND